MKLKSIVVASTVCLLGLGTSAIASTGSKSDSRADMNQLQARSNQIEATLNQNEGSILAGKPYLGSDWAKRITISGELNVDGKWRSKHGPTGTDTTGEASLFQSGYYNDIYLNNSQIDLDAYINSWTQAHISLTGRDPMEVDNRYRSDVADNAPVNMDEAYITIGDLDKYPVYGTFGRQYVPFGVYDRHAIAPTLTQYLSQTQATAAKVGMAMPMGIYGSLYTFRGQSSVGGNGDYNVNNFGGEIGITNNQNIGSMPLGYQLSIGYLEDLGDVDWIANVAGSGLAGGGTGGHDVNAVSIDGKLSTGPFALRGNYVQALGHFQTADNFAPGSLANALDAAQPWAVGVAGDYSFDVMGHDSTFSLNYQQAGDTRVLGLPKIRYGGSYTVGVLKDTNVTFELFEDENYTSSTDSRYATEGDLRLSVDF